MSRLLRNERPLLRHPRKRSMDERRLEAYWGAQYSPSLELWIGFLWDGKVCTTFEPRTTRERALGDGRVHYDRIFHQEEPGELYIRTVGTKSQ